MAADGFGLVELLIALMVLNVGIFATVAAFNSGALALRRASMTATAGALADREMERLRSLSYTNLVALPTSATQAVTGPDSRSYLIETLVQAPASQSTGSGSYQGGRPAIVVTVRIHQGNSVANTVLARAGSSFDQCTQDRTAATCGGGSA